MPEKLGIKKDYTRDKLGRERSGTSFLTDYYRIFRENPQHKGGVSLITPDRQVKLFSQTLANRSYRIDKVAAQQVLI